MKARELGSLKGSIKKGGGNVYGFVGEILAAQHLGAMIENTYDYDVMTASGLKYDVKTKSCTSEPKPEYACSVASYNTKQNCDFYLFTRVKQDLSYAWLLGYIAKEDFYKKAKFCKKGDRDPDSKQGWCFRADCFNLYIDQLTPLDAV